MKASTGPATTVEPTHGEVNHARTFQPTDLFAVSGSTWHRSGDDVVTTLGTEMVIDGWAPVDTDLKPIRFRHAVPTPLLKPAG